MLDWKVSIPELVTNMQQALGSSLLHSAVLYSPSSLSPMYQEDLYLTLSLSLYFFPQQYILEPCSTPNSQLPPYMYREQLLHIWVHTTS